MSQAVFSGSLRPKRKGELQTIAKALSVDLQEGTKVEFEAAIRTALRASTKAQKDPRFADLWKSIQEGEQRRSSARAKSESARSDFGDMESEQPSDSERGSPQRSMTRLAEAGRIVADEVTEQAVEVGSYAAEQAQLVAQSAAEYAQEQFQEGQEALIEAYQNAPPASEVILHADQHAHRLGKALARWTSESVVPSARQTQRIISSSWAIIGVTLLMEVLFMVSATVPYTRQVHVNGWKWAFVQFTADHPWSITLPDLAVLYQYSFIRVFSIWVFSTILLPLLAAHLVVFPRPSKNEFKSASPVTFSIVRLALDVYLHKIAVGPSFDWSGSIIQRFGDVQLLSSATALAFALYENSSKQLR